jgi:BirA family transcriptional regulator, biotin operon repressor / biotin---[acetyl-CoA-carboxylase] ligase
VTDNVIWVDRAASTQDLIHELGADGADDGTAVVAVEQTAGRGSRGRAWASPRGGLWLSVLCRPAAAAPPEALSVRVALAVADALETQALTAADAPPVQLKWPNDLLLAGRKIGGILSEARWQGERLGWIAVGVGINVSNPLPLELQAVAAALEEFAPGIRTGDLAPAVIAAVRGAARIPVPLDAAERARFAARDALAGRLLREPTAGTADGIEADGALRVRRPDGGVDVVRVGPAVPVSL